MLEVRSRTVTVLEYKWWRGDGGEIKPEHEDALRETADRQIRDSRSGGYTCGRLVDNVLMSDEDGEDGVYYQGWWSVKTEDESETDADDDTNCENVGNDMKLAEI